jgi:hypothetical protein
MRPYQSSERMMPGGGRIPSQTSRTIHDPVPVLIEVQRALTPITEAVNELGMAASVNIKPLKELIDVEAEMAKSREQQGVASDAAARLRAQLDAAGTKKRKRDPLFDEQFTREGVAGDFHSGLSGLLGNLGWEKPGSLAKQFGIGLLRDIQGRMANDFSSMITGAIFGGRGEDGKLTGGLFGGGGFNLGGIFSKLFGGLFGGFRASGGSMSSGRFYVAGENGPEIISGPGYVHNARQSEQMMGGSGDPHYTIVAIGDREVGRAVDAYRNTGRGRRARVIDGKYNRKIMAYG